MNTRNKIFCAAVASSVIIPIIGFSQTDYKVDDDINEIKYFPLQNTNATMLTSGCTGMIADSSIFREYFSLQELKDM
jgi:hypothetical protein